MRKLLAISCLFAALTGRAEQVVFSEIMFHPVGTSPEFIEVWNITYTPLDMVKWRFTNGITFEFPEFDSTNAQAAFLKPQERIIVSAADEATTRAAYPSIPAGVRVFGPWTGVLENSGERITLTDKNGIPLCTVNYQDGGRWPKAADGTGHSLVLKNENRFIDDFRVWRASNTPGGTPGLPDPAPTGFPLRLSEAHFVGNSVNWVELENNSIAAVDAATLSVASTRDFSDKVPLSGSIAPHGFASWGVNFAASAGGDVTLYLIDATGTVLGTAELERPRGRDSVQAIYPGVPAPIPTYEYVRADAEWYASETDTRDLANNPSRNVDIVINEIMCDPPSGHEDGEFIELTNKGTTAVSLAGWKLRAGVDFDFPASASIPPGGYLVVAGNAAALQQMYSGLSAVGDWNGTLRNSGDLIRLIDNFGNLADEVDYRVGGDWPSLAGGLGSSLELQDPSLDNNRSSAWRDSDEGNKTEFQTYTVTGTYGQLNSLGSPTDYKELHFFLVGDSHIVLRNITLRQNGTGTNVILNGTTQSTNGSSATGWLMQGTHYASFIDAGGEMHLIADGHGDNRPNRAEIDCTGLLQNQSFTLQFEARWVYGAPRLIAQTWDHSVGKPFLIPIPNNLGTPGAVNSVAASAPPPQVDSVLHSPAVPKVADPVTVTARVASNTSVTVEVIHRIDSVNNTNAWVNSPMFDDGTNGDAIANDGVYSATLTAHQVNNRIVQFYVRATNAGGLTSEAPRLGAARPAMWMVDNRTVPSTLRRQRFIISLYDRDGLNTNSGQSAKFGYDFPRLSNHYFNCVFIHDERDVFYNAEIRKSGSPWTRTDANTLDRGKWKVPGDRVFRNRDKSTYDNDATNSTSRHHNRLIRYWLYLFGHPANENEFVNLVVNADGINVREDTEAVDNNLLDRCFPDGKNGELMRSDDEWWFQDDWNRTQRNADWSYKGTPATIRYHTEWMARSREAQYDYSSLVEFFRTVSNASSSRDLVDRTLDPQLTLMMAAIRGYAYDWDSLTLTRGKNGFFYRKPTDGRWMFLHWDSDLAFQDANNIVAGGLPGWSTYISKPWNRRLFNYYLTEMLTKFTKNSARVSAWFDAEEAASTAYPVSKAFYTSWFTARESRIISEINGAFGGGTGGAYTAAFAVTTPGGTTTTANTVDLTGTAPSSAFQIVVDGHPEGVFRWTNQTVWTLTGLLLQGGVNTFTVRSVDAQGNSIATTTFTITKSDDAPPVMALTANPASRNVALGEILTLDATTSFDPEQGVLTFAWSNTPSAGARVSNPTATTAMAVFEKPGIYSFTVTGTDPAGLSAPLSREVLAYNSADFSPMDGKQLDPVWQVQNIERRDNFSGAAWYSTEDQPGNLLVQVLDDSPKPADVAAATHPLITRPLPLSGDFALQTDLTLKGRQTGTFFTGLVVDTLEDGSPVRYLFGIDAGTSVSVKRWANAALTTVGTQAASIGSAVLRIWRVGDELRFQRMVNDAWQTAIAVQTLPAGTTMGAGGVFAATAAPENVRIAFDYIVLADPGNTTAVSNNLRITEVMFNPAQPETVEFIEMRNVGSGAINLQGVKFQADTPFDEFLFGNETLAPGEFIVVTNDLVQFRARYGKRARVAGEWSGELNNNGERIVLLNAQGDTVHDFFYDDVPPWPVSADGDGPSMEVVNVNGNYNDGANWSASYEIGGSPGYQGAGPDSDHDGSPDSFETMFGTDPHNPESLPRISVTLNEDDHSVVAWPSAAGRNYRVEYCDDLEHDAWHTLATITGTPGSSSFIDPTSPKPSQRFYRVVALP